MTDRSHSGELRDTRRLILYPYRDADGPSGKGADILATTGLLKPGGVLTLAEMSRFTLNNAPLAFSTFGLCTNRLLFAAFDAARTPDGFRLPAMLRPFGATVIPRTRQYEVQAHEIMLKLESAGLDVVLDDRYKLSAAERDGFANMLGIPTCTRVDAGCAEYRSWPEPLGFRAAPTKEIVGAALRGAQS